MRSRQSAPHDGSADLARMMVPADANIAGNVHGGTIMQLMEEAAGVAANRYFSASNGSNNNGNSRHRIAALLSRVERLTFQHPIHVGDVAQVHAKVVFASSHSVAVCVQVRAERLAWSTGTTSRMDDGDDDTTICNRALLWLVGAILPSNSQTSVHQLNPKRYTRALAPPFPIPNRDHDEEAWINYQQAADLYQESKQKCDNIDESTEAEEEVGPSHQTQPVGLDSQSTLSSTTTTITPSNHSSFSSRNNSAVELVQVMLPADCVSSTGLVSGGVVMKLMDNACGIVAVRHCGTNTVTVSVNCVNLVAPVLLGDILKVRARPVFTSQRSMEILVTVSAERFMMCGGVLMRQEVVTTEQAFFTFVALPLVDNNNNNSNGAADGQRALPMRPLLLESEHDRALFEQRRVKYQQRKASSRRQVLAKL